MLSTIIQNMKYKMKIFQNSEILKNLINFSSFNLEGNILFRFPCTFVGSFFTLTFSLSFFWLAFLEVSYPSSQLFFRYLVI